MANRFWVGAGNWDASNTANWSASSGGTTGASVPTSSDDVFFDANSGNCNTLNGVTVSAKNIDMTGYTATFTGFNSLTSAIQIFGKLILSASATYNTNISTWQFAATDDNSGMGYDIVTHNKILGTIRFQGVGGKWNILGSLTARGTYTHTNGEVTNVGEHKISATTFSWSGNQARTYNPGQTVHGSNGTGGLTHYNISDATNLIGDFSNTTFQIDTPSASTKTINTGTVKIGRIDYLADAATNGVMNINSGAVIGTIAATTDNGRQKDIAFTAMTVDNLEINTSGTGKIVIRSGAAGTARLLTIGKPGVLIANNNVEFKDVTCVHPYRLFAPNGSDAGNNLNVNFTAPPDAPLIRQENASFISGVNVNPVSFLHTPQAGNTLLAIIDVAANPGSAITLQESGWAQIATSFQGVSANLYVFSKIATGSETTVTAQWTTSRASQITIYEIENVQGTLTLENSQQNSGTSIGSGTPFSTGAGITPSIVPGIAIAALGSSGGLGSSAAGYANNNFQESRSTIYAGSSTVQKIAAKPFVSAASETTEFAWATARNIATLMLIFIDVESGRKIKYKSAGVFVEYDHKVKVGGSFS